MKVQIRYFLTLVAFSVSVGLGTIFAQSAKPEDAAKSLFSAWKSNKRADAARVGMPAAVKFIFSQDKDQQYDFEGCNKQGTIWHCFYRDNDGGAMNMTMTKVAGGYKVRSIAYFLD